VLCALLQVVGVNTVEVEDAEGLIRFFSECFDNRAVGATKMNDRSSRSHAIYTVLINRTLVDVSDCGDKVCSPCCGAGAVLYMLLAASIVLHSSRQHSQCCAGIPCSHANMPAEADSHVWQDQKQLF